MDDATPSNGPGAPSKNSSFSIAKLDQRTPLPMSSNSNDKVFGVDILLSPRSSSRHATLALLSMAMLTLQGSAISIVLRYSRIKKGKKYLPSVAVLITEAIKLAICIVFKLREDQKTFTGTSSGSSFAPRRPLAAVARAAVYDALPMALPAGLFVAQQVLLIGAATYLDAVSYQIFNQAFKLIPTAVFARVLLDQRLELVQWASIPVLAAGVIVVTLNNGPTNEAVKQAPQAKWFLGMIACSFSGMSSAFAGVYFEKYVKGRNAASLWVRNIQLAAFGLPFSGLYAWSMNQTLIRQYGWLQGFGISTWIVIALQVFGGLVTGMVVKYCDNILKNFSLAISVILTVLLAIPLFGQWPSTFFLGGVGLVLLSVFMYGQVIKVQPIQRWLASVGWGSKDWLTVFAACLGGAALGGAILILRWEAPELVKTYSGM